MLRGQGTPQLTLATVYTVGLTSVRHKGEAQGQGDEIEIVNYCTLLTGGPAKPDPPNGGSKRKNALKNKDFSIFCMKKKIFCTLSGTFTQNIWLVGLFEFMLEMLK